MQLPKDYLPRLDIQGRVRLELREGEIVIHPVEHAVDQHDAERLASELASVPRAQSVLGLFRRFRPEAGGAKKR